MVPEAERELQRTRELLSARVEAALEHARVDLAAADRDLSAAVAQELSGELDSPQPAPPALSTWLLRRRWQRAAAAAVSEGDLPAQVAVLCAAQAGVDRLRPLLARASTHRAPLLAAAAETARRAELVTRVVKTQTLAQLADERARLCLGVRAEAHPAAVAVWDAGQRVRRELVATGARTPEWVEEHVPAVPKPDPPSAPGTLARHDVAPGAKWPHGPGPHTYTLVAQRRDVRDRATVRWLSEVIGDEEAGQVADRLLAHRPEGGVIRVDGHGDVTTQRRNGGGRFYLGRVGAAEWFPEFVASQPAAIAVSGRGGTVRDWR